MKIVSTSIYVHKTALYQILNTVNEKEKKSILDRLEYANYLHFDYTIIKYDKKTRNVSLIYSPDFDIANEPLVGDSICIHEDNTYKIIKSTGKIYHSKELFVDNNYIGFDIQRAKERTKLWNSIPDIKEHKSRIGSRVYWIELLNQYNIPL